MEKTKPSFNDLINGDKPVLIDFYTDWCQPCKMMNPILKEVKSSMGDRINVVKINAETNPDAAIRYQVRGVPTLVLIREGKVIWQQSGVIQAPALTGIIEQHLS
ncbi:thioredoxin [Balneola sp. MJW-20]|uniref:thioredoxin n=1 Tax=Gracilimonas aurantiaca TaxID=3234185 RepID=UPI00346534B6